MQYFHIHVASRSCSRDETRKTEWLNSQGNQREKDLKNGEEKGGTIRRWLINDSAANGESAIGKCTERL